MFPFLIDPASAKLVATMRLDEEVAAAQARAAVRLARQARRDAARAAARSVRS